MAMDKQTYREISKSVKESGIPLDFQKVIQRLLDKELMESEKKQDE